MRRRRYFLDESDAVGNKLLPFGGVVSNPRKGGVRPEMRRDGLKLEHCLHVREKSCEEHCNGEL